MSAKFGTSGLRGLVGDLTDGIASVHARAFVRHLASNAMVGAGSAVYLGRDMRASSPVLVSQCAAAVRAEGFVPVDCGVVPTPALALHAMRQGAAALMVTGSHIPDDRNGVKFYRPDGEIDKIDEAAISTLTQNFAVQTIAKHQPMRNEHRQVLDDFISRYRGFVPDRGFRGLRIGLYEHSSAASEALARILDEAGATVVRLGRSDRFVPVDTEAVSEETCRLSMDWVRSQSLDGLVSTDGDGDRPLVVDETGAVLRGDALGLIVARFLDADALVTPVTSNSGIENWCPAQVRRTRVGSPFVIVGMNEALVEGMRRVIGFEANGGVLTGNTFVSGDARLAPLPTRDSVLPILCAFAAAQQSGQSLSALVASLALPVAASDRLENFPTAQSQALIARLSGDAAACTAFFADLGTVDHVDQTDGLRVTLGGHRIVHLRPSGNAPEMRIYSEAPTELEARILIASAVDLVREGAK